MNKTSKRKRTSFYSNKITVPFEKAVDILLSTHPKKKAIRKKKSNK